MFQVKFTPTYLLDKFDHFRLIKYFFVESRPSERETAKSFFDAIRSTNDIVLKEYGYDAAWGPENIVISYEDRLKIPVLPAHFKQNISIFSSNSLALTVFDGGSQLPKWECNYVFDHSPFGYTATASYRKLPDGEILKDEACGVGGLDYAAYQAGEWGRHKLKKFVGLRILKDDYAQSTLVACKLSLSFWGKICPADLDVALPDQHGKPSLALSERELEIERRSLDVLEAALEMSGPRKGAGRVRQSATQHSGLFSSLIL